MVCVDLNHDAANETARMIVGDGGKAIAVKADVSRSEDAASMVATAESEFGRLDVLFNNAGIMHSADDDAISTEEQVWDLTMSINAKGVFWVQVRNRRCGERRGSLITRLLRCCPGGGTPSSSRFQGAVLALTRTRRDSCPETSGSRSLPVRSHRSID